MLHDLPPDLRAQPQGVTAKTLPKGALEIDPADAGVRYNVGCLYALEGRHDEAIVCLTECVRLGFGNSPWIARDPDLASLHGDPQFDDLIASLEAPVASAGKPGIAGRS